MLEGVRPALDRIYLLGLTMLIVTEGAQERIRLTAQHHKLDSIFSKILEAPKTERLFRRIRRLVGEHNVAIMIGDQLKSDIRPAKEAGVTTIYVPSRFKPKWELEDHQTCPDFQVESFNEIVAIVEKTANLCYPA